MSDSVVIVGMARTAMGGMQGVFNGVPVTELGANAIRGALADAGVQPDEVAAGGCPWQGFDFARFL